MAIVREASDAGPVDKSFCTHNREMAGTPNGTLTPEYAGEIVFDSTNKVRWKAIGLTNEHWVPIETEVT